MQDLFTSLFEHSSDLDVHVIVEVTSQEAASGVRRRIVTFQSNMLCPGCQGRGVVDGLFLPKGCDMCQGQGVVPYQRQLEVDIPAGVRDEARLHLPGEGLLGLFGAPRGSLNLTLRVQAGPFVQRAAAAQTPTTPAPRARPAAQAPTVQNQPNGPNAPHSGLQAGSLLGTQLGNYRLLRLLGTGGFADVYLSQHQFLNTQAAIKV